MKPLTLIIVFSFVATLALAETQVRDGATYEYDKDELLWDKKAFDTPPQIIGGYSDLVWRLSYPRELRARSIQGAATVTVSLYSDGRITSVTFAPRMPPDLERLVTTAVRSCHWKSGERNGRPVPGRVWFPAKFVLRDP
jgi:TonB family protein